ncbi:hypothetical protein C2869_02035 [Saccharobesus litoralis]|uniref:Right handed beta helix domain-containing protein n=1 Tax=Saccharobesus litoralis TaxID=2172099 RepID=A0A2S0VM57_9ALTE|nr:thrombospondin type 3 repeat-containing protein [Saccharobesus litoralis]AWB65297.1 hypothetical protein C2869_02035 [Saccharobesus litoralis]
MVINSLLKKLFIPAVTFAAMSNAVAAPAPCQATGGASKCGAANTQQFVDGLQNNDVAEVVITNDLSFDQNITIRRWSKKVTSFFNNQYDISFGPNARLNILSANFIFSGHSDVNNITRTIRFLRDTSITGNIVGKNKQIFLFNGRHQSIRVNNVLVDGSARFIDMTAPNTDLQDADIVIRHNTVRDFIHKAIEINRRNQHYTEINSLQITKNRFEAPALWEMAAINGPKNRMRAISLDAGNDMSDCLATEGWSRAGNCIIQGVSDGQAPGVAIGTTSNPGIIQGNTFINSGVAFARYENVLVGHSSDKLKRNRFFTNDQLPVTYAQSRVYKLVNIENRAQHIRVLGNEFNMSEPGDRSQAGILFIGSGSEWIQGFQSGTDCQYQSDNIHFNNNYLTGNGIYRYGVYAYGIANWTFFNNDYADNAPSDKVFRLSENCFDANVANTEIRGNTGVVSGSWILPDTGVVHDLDYVDNDWDNDGVVNELDAFPYDPSESVDTDGDGVGNNADTDDDNDGVNDQQDAFPLNQDETTDTDGDGLGNNQDEDDDGDNVLDHLDIFPLNSAEWSDFDQDLIGDNADNDDDNDGVDDLIDQHLGLIAGNAIVQGIDTEVADRPNSVGVPLSVELEQALSQCDESRGKSYGVCINLPLKQLQELGSLSHQEWLYFKKIFFKNAKA